MDDSVRLSEVNGANQLWEEVSHTVAESYSLRGAYDLFLSEY